MTNLIRRLTKNQLTLALYFVLAAMVLQYSPIAMELLVSKRLAFDKGSSFEWEGDASNLQPGKYYISVGRPRGPCELLYNGRVISSTKGEIPGIRPQLILGAGVEVFSHAPNEKLIAKVICENPPGFSSMLYHRPIIAEFFSGFLLQTARVFLDLILGPLASFMLLFSMLSISPKFSHELSFGKPFIIFGAAAFLYSVSLSNVGNLFLSGEETTALHIVLRNSFSAAFVYLCANYSRPNKKLLLAHIVSAGAACILGAVSIDRLRFFYTAQYILFPLSSLIATVDLCRFYTRSHVSKTLISLGLAWSFLQCIDLINKLFFSAPFISPSFIAIFAVTVAIVRYQELVKAETSAHEAIADANTAAEIAQLSAKIAHDIRSPLALLKVLSRDGSIPAELRGLLSSASDRIRSIAENLLEKHRQLTSSVGTSRKAVSSDISQQSDLVELISQIIEERKRLAERVSIRFDHGLNTRVLAFVEPTEFSRVISNLFDNAIESMNAIGNIEVCLVPSSDHVQLSIRDSGRGISSDVLPRLFEYRASFGKSYGNGLGLFNAKTTIESWGGSIQLKSVLGQGAEVLITLPCE
jgi:signal transduction histidine kinase